ncbi:UvrB/UvrC motif-containing protein, partial [Candidatus Saccharibacteria bacterium]|nr:UvrB/UvrC motif-containing protein [Candidatus Saccharibacteria bacterium]
SMKTTIDETQRRRKIQEDYNTKHGITPTGVDKVVDEGLRAIIGAPEKDKKPKLDLKKIPKEEYHNLIKELESQMDLAAANLRFEEAADIRDQIADIQKKL